MCVSVFICVCVCVCMCRRWSTVATNHLKRIEKKKIETSLDHCFKSGCFKVSIWLLCVFALYVTFYHWPFQVSCCVLACVKCPGEHSHGTCALWCV